MLADWVIEVLSHEFEIDDIELNTVDVFMMVWFNHHVDKIYNTNDTNTVKENLIELMIDKLGTQYVIFLPGDEVVEFDVYGVDESYNYCWSAVSDFYDKLSDFNSGNFVSEIIDWLNLDYIIKNSTSNVITHASDGSAMWNIY